MKQNVFQQWKRLENIFCLRIFVKYKIIIFCIARTVASVKIVHSNLNVVITANMNLLNVILISDILVNNPVKKLYINYVRLDVIVSSINQDSHESPLVTNNVSQVQSTTQLLQIYAI